MRKQEEKQLQDYWARQVWKKAGHREESDSRRVIGNKCFIGWGKESKADLTAWSQGRGWSLWKDNTEWKTAIDLQIYR